MKKDKRSEKKYKRERDPQSVLGEIKKTTKSYTGIIQMRKNGNGKIVSTEIEGDIFIPRIFTNDAFDGDDGVPAELGDYLDELQVHLGALHARLSETFFHRELVESEP